MEWRDRSRLLSLISPQLCWKISLGVKKIMKHHPVYHLKGESWHVQIVCDSEIKQQTILTVKLNSKQLHIHKREYPSEQMMAYIYVLKA